MIKLIDQVYFTLAIHLGNHWDIWEHLIIFKEDFDAYDLIVPPSPSDTNRFRPLHVEEKDYSNDLEKFSDLPSWHLFD